MHVLIVTPHVLGVHTGNAVTAARWKRLLERLDVRVTVAERWKGQACDVLVALHARKSASSIRRSIEAAPRRPIVVALTGTDVYGDGPLADATRASLNSAKRIIALQAEAPKRLPASLRDRVRVIVQSVEVPADLERPQTDSFDVAVVGHLREVKDPLRAALAARLLPASSKIRVLHFGDALEPSWSQAAADESAANPRYVWLGGVTHEETLRALARCRLHALTSRLEGGANAVCEALALGVPTLSSHIDGTIGLLGADWPGYFPVGDEAALAKLMERAETDAAFLAQLVRRTAELAEQVRPERELAAWRSLLDELFPRRP